MEDSEEKILKDWCEPHYVDSLKKSVNNFRFRTFDELYRYLKLFAKYQGGKERFNLHPYDNFHHYVANKLKYNKVQRRLWEESNLRDKREEKADVNRRLKFWIRIKEYRKAKKLLD